MHFAVSLDSSICDFFANFLIADITGNQQTACPVFFDQSLGFFGVFMLI
jgi:hypothetical protein